MKAKLNRLTERYDPEALRLRPHTAPRSDAILWAVDDIGISGQIFHCLRDIPDQFDDEFTVLIDDRQVVVFELPRAEGSRPEEVQIYSLDDFKRMIGQGRDRILLEACAEAARSIAKQSR